MVIACDNDVNFTPTAPDWPEGQLRLSMISGNNQTGTIGQPLGAPKTSDRRLGGAQDLDKLLRIGIACIESGH